MKKLNIKKSTWQSLLSVIALTVFAYFAIASFGAAQQKRLLPDGRYEIYKQYAGGNTETITGNVDEYGRWKGPTTIVYENDNYIQTHTEEVEMKAGNRHGVSKVTYPTGEVYKYCYQHGQKVGMENCGQKSATIGSAENSAYQIFSYKYPWFAFKLEAFGYDSDYVKAYMDTLELVLYSSVFIEEEFDDFYDDAVSDLEDTPYDSIIQWNYIFTIYNGIDLILDHEFRLATLYSYAQSDSNTYQAVETIYPNYLLTLNDYGVTDTDFEGFCVEYDLIMSSYDPVALDDPFLTDSLDARMFRAISLINSSEEATAILSLKSAELPKKAEDIQTFQQEYLSQRRTEALNITPQAVSDVVLVTIFEKFLYGDYIKNAVKEAYTINEGIVSLPTVITDFSGNASATSVKINGNVIEDGGGAVTSKGIAWEAFYNPTIDNQIVTAGTGTGDFSATLTGLTEGETYYARAFATNSAGTAYGNCISFVAQNTTGIGAAELSTLDFIIYPNPASDHVTLTFHAKDSKEMVFTMFDLSGKVILQKEVGSSVQGENRMGVDLSEIESGLYTCWIKGGENMHAMQKLLISR